MFHTTGFSAVPSLISRVKTELGSSRINPGAEFLRIFIVTLIGYFRLSYLMVGDCPAGARNRRKATVKIRRNTVLVYPTRSNIIFPSFVYFFKFEFSQFFYYSGVTGKDNGIKFK